MLILYLLTGSVKEVKKELGKCSGHEAGFSYTSLSFNFCLTKITIQQCFYSYTCKCVQIENYSITIAHSRWRNGPQNLEMKTISILFKDDSHLW